MYNSDGTQQQAEPDQLAMLEHVATAHDASLNAEYEQAVGAADSALNAPQVGFDPAAECSVILTTARNFLAPLYPTVAKVYDDATIEQLSNAAAPVMVKYNVTSNGLLSKFGPEIMLAVVVAPVAIKTVAAVRFDNAAREAANDDAEKVVNGSN